MPDTIRTERLELRRLHTDDAVWMNACVRDPQIHRNVGKIPADQTLQDTHTFIERASRSWDEGNGYIFLIETGTLPIGVIGGGYSAYTEAYEIGYWDRPCWLGIWLCHRSNTGLCRLAASVCRPTRADSRLFR